MLQWLKNLLLVNYLKINMSELTSSYECLRNLVNRRTLYDKQPNNLILRNNKIYKLRKLTWGDDPKDGDIYFLTPHEDSKLFTMSVLCLHNDSNENWTNKRVYGSEIKFNIYQPMRIIIKKRLG